MKKGEETVYLVQTGNGEDWPYHHVLFLTKKRALRWARMVASSGMQDMREETGPSKETPDIIAEWYDQHEYGKFVIVRTVSLFLWGAPRGDVDYFR